MTMSKDEAEKAMMSKMIEIIKKGATRRLRARLVRRLIRLTVLVGGAAAVAYASGQIVAKGLARGDEDSDDFSLLTIVTSKDLAIGATPFGYGSVMTLLGRTRIDLRDTTLDPSGAHLDLVTSFARVEVIVPAGWAVEIKQVSSGFRSELSVDISDADSLPEDAPKLSIMADTRWGCGSIKAAAANDPS